MSTFMSSNKRIVVKSVNSSLFLELGIATTLSFYIIERNQNTTLSTIDYQVEKISGRDTTILTTWTSVSLVDVDDHIYSFDYTVTGVTTSDKLLIRFKVVDEDGLESFVELNDFKVVI